MAEIKLRKNKKIEKAELEKLTKEELIEKLVCSEAHNVQLKNIISRNVGTSNKPGNQKPYDFTKAHFRHVLLKLYYLGWNYQGFVVQEDTTNTVENQLFQALLKTCLIKDRDSSNYHRCGRTDKGVSSFGQVISIDLRSKFCKSEQESNVDKEINYCKVLNRVLPHDIQCIAWCPVQDAYSARFDCKNRTYKYFFPKGNLNIEAMKLGLTYLLGTHDFRNFCKMDVANGVTNFVRNIISTEISPFASDDTEAYTMYHLTLTGQAFLWHQVRCIVAVLFLIGQNKESPEVIKELLDIDKNPRKPDYNLAREIPLNLYNCDYDADENWVFDSSTLSEVISNLQKTWTVFSTKTTMVKSMLNDLESTLKATSNELSYNSVTECLMTGVKPKVYKPLMERQKCDALEDKIQHYVKKRKIVVTEDENKTEM